MLKEKALINRGMEIVISALAVILKTFGEINTDVFSNLKGFNPIEIWKSEWKTLVKAAESRKNMVNDTFVFKLQRNTQKLLNSWERKKFAVYFTKPLGLKIMSEVAIRFLNEGRRKRVSIADPFLGSGLTLTSFIEKAGREHASIIFGSEIHPILAFVAYSAILYFLDGDIKRVVVFVGDSFKNLANGRFKADIVLTNPPFTRWEILSSDYRTFLRSFVKKQGYHGYIVRSQLNLQLVSLFLIDNILNCGGLLVSVLPASTFYTNSGEAVKRLLRERYRILGLIEYLEEASFSTDSGFKELIMICTKEHVEGSCKTAFISVEKENEVEDVIKSIFKNRKTNLTPTVNYVDLCRIPSLWDMNWLTFFGRGKFRRILSKIFIKGFRRGALSLWEEYPGRSLLVRGIEMYGPNFFIIPNKHWRITHINEKGVVIERIGNGKSLFIDEDYIKPVLRKPSLYKNCIKPNLQYYILVIPPIKLRNLSKNLREYVSWGIKSGVAKNAIKVFGRFWFSHVLKQIKTKNPYGKVFLPDKIDLRFKNRGVFANYTEDFLTATKNFYIIKIESDLYSKVLTAWFNSTPFLALLIFAGRRISKTWTRFLKEDYLRIPVIRLKSIEREVASEICDCLNDMISMGKLPPLLEQVDKKYRFRLDNAVIDAIGFNRSEDLVYELYDSLFELLTPVI